MLECMVGQILLSGANKNVNARVHGCADGVRDNRLTGFGLQDGSNPKLVECSQPKRIKNILASSTHFASASSINYLDEIIEHQRIVELYHTHDISSLKINDM